MSKNIQYAFTEFAQGKKQANSCTGLYLVCAIFSWYKNSTLENGVGGNKRKLLDFFIYWPAKVGYSTYKSNTVFLKTLSCRNPHETDDSLEEDSKLVCLWVYKMLYMSPLPHIQEECWPVF